MTDTPICTLECNANPMRIQFESNSNAMREMQMNIAVLTLLSSHPITEATVP